MEQQNQPSLRTYQNGTFRLVEDRTRQGKARQRLLIGVNIASLVMTAALVLLGVLAIYRVSGCIGTFTIWTPVILLLGTLALIVLHEGLHTLGARWLGKAPRGTVRLGFDRRSLCAYSLCEVPVTVMAFRQATLLPLWVCALLPMALGLAMDNVLLWTLGAVMAGGSLADLWYIWDVRSVPAGCYILELPPDRSGFAVGCIVLERADDEGCEATDILQSDFPERILKQDDTPAEDLEAEEPTADEPAPEGPVPEEPVSEESPSEEPKTEETSNDEQPGN